MNNNWSNSKFIFFFLQFLKDWQGFCLSKSGAEYTHTPATNPEKTSVWYHSLSKSGPQYIMPSQALCLGSNHQVKCSECFSTVTWTSQPTSPSWLKLPFISSEETAKVRLCSALLTQRSLCMPPSHADWITSVHFLWPRSEINSRLQLIQMQQLKYALEPGKVKALSSQSFSSCWSNFKI